MIICKLTGGLGNQLFQWAFAKSIQLKYNTDLIFDISFLLKTIPGITKRNYELYKFPKLKSESLLEKQIYFSGITINDNTDIAKIDYSKNLFLNGYFQNKKYISFYSDINSFLQPNINDLDIENDLLQKIINTNSVSIHVRRTDYLTSNGHHPVQSIDYYNNAINKIKDYDNIFVFSDDINWCKNHLSYKNMHFMENFDCVYDLWLMSLCKNNIIANSSFSWWASYLNLNPKKIIVAPKKWFGLFAPDNDSLAMDNWIRIDS